MERLNNTHMIIMLTVSLVVALNIMAFHGSCHLGEGALCFLTMCAMILTSGGIGLLLISNTLPITLSADSSISLTFRLDRPPRS